MAVGALAVLAPCASALIVQEKNGHRLGVTLFNTINESTVPRSIATHPGLAPLAPNGNLDYHGGPVAHSTSPYLIFWVPSGHAISATTESLITRYFTDVAHDSGLSNDVYGVDRQFSDAAGFADNQHTLSAAQVIVDTNIYPAKDTVNCVNTNVPSGDACITDTQLKTEVANVIAANGWPNDGSTSNAELNPIAPIYFVVLPTDVNECGDSATCADNAICAYHSAMSIGGNYVLYSAIPLLPTVLSVAAMQPGKQCQFDGNTQVQDPNGDPASDIANKYISHEDNETITDPLLNAWFNGNLAHENGDECNSIGQSANAFTPTLGGTAGAGTLYNQLINGHQYYIQSEWSNGDVGCEMRPTAGTMSASLTGPAGATPVGTAVNFTPAASSANGYSSVTIDFADGTTSFDNSGAAPSAKAHAYAHAGLYTAKLTTVDPRGNIASSTAQFTIGSPPTAAFSFSPSHAATGVPIIFTSTSTDRDAGITISSTAFSFGDGGNATSSTATHTFSRPGNYTVTEAVTSSLNLQSMVSHTITIVAAKIKKIKVTHITNTGATINVTINAPGKVSADHKTGRRSTPGTVKLKIKLTVGQEIALAAAGHLTLKIKVKFVPAAGKTVSKTITITF
jgi:PKD repeat protein